MRQRYRLTQRLSWTGSYGVYYQQPFFLFLAAFDQNRQTAPFPSGALRHGF